MARKTTDEPLDDIPEELRQRVAIEHGDLYGFRMTLIGNYYSGHIWAHLQKHYRLLRDEFTILAQLHDYGPMTANVICAMAGRPKNSVSRGAIRLARDGMITSEPDSADRRHVILTITSQGEALLEKAMTLFRKREQEMFGCLTPDEFQSLDAITRKILDSWHGRSSTSKRALLAS